MASQNSLPSKSALKHEALLLAGVALFFLLALMATSFFYPYPGGKRPDLLSLLLFWSREALIVVLALIGLLGLAFERIVKAIEKSR